MKITKERLKQLIKEELQQVEEKYTPVPEEQIANNPESAIAHINNELTILDNDMQKIYDDHDALQGENAGMKEIIKLAKELHLYLFNTECSVKIHNGNGVLATYGKGDLQFSYKALGKKWFNLLGNKQKIIELIIHEFGHWYSSDHLSEQYYNGLCEIGAKLYCKEY